MKTCKNCKTKFNPLSLEAKKAYFAKVRKSNYEASLRLEGFDKMKGRSPTANEKRHMSAVRALGCIACRNQGIDTPEQFTCIHHVDGKTKPNAHFKVLPLCDPHHSRYHKTGFHYNPTQWQSEHGTQEELLAQVERLLA